MFTREKSIVVNVPVDTVSIYLADLSLQIEWDGDVDLKVVAMSPKSVRVGSSCSRKGTRYFNSLRDPEAPDRRWKPPLIPAPFSYGLHYVPDPDPLEIKEGITVEKKAICQGHL